MNLNTDLGDVLNKVTARLSGKPSSQGTDGRPPSPGEGKQSPPEVNLLPAKYAKIIKAKSTARISAVASACALVLIAGSCVAVQLHATSAQDQLTQARARNGELTAELATYAPVTNLARQTTELTATVSAQTDGLLSHDEVISEFLKVTSQGMEVESLGLMTNAAQLSECRPTDSFNQNPMVGCISFTGTSPTRDSVARVLRDLSSNPWFTDAYIPTLTEGSDRVTNAGTVGVTPSATQQDLESDQDPTDQVQEDPSE